MDGIIQYTNGWTGLEYKTSGYGPEIPKRQHSLQIRTYNSLLKVCYKIILRGYVVMYLERGNLKRHILGPYDAANSRQLVTDWMFRSINGYKAATRVLKDPSVQNIKRMVAYRPCQSAEDHENYMARRYDFSKKPCPLLPYCSKGDSSCGKAVHSILKGGMA